MSADVSKTVSLTITSGVVQIGSAGGGEEHVSHMNGKRWATRTVGKPRQDIAWAERLHEVHVIEAFRPFDSLQTKHRGARGASARMRRKS